MLSSSLGLDDQILSTLLGPQRLCFSLADKHWEYLWKKIPCAATHPDKHSHKHVQEFRNTQCHCHSCWFYSYGHYQTQIYSTAKNYNNNNTRAKISLSWKNGQILLLEFVKHTIILLRFESVPQKKTDYNKYLNKIPISISKGAVTFVAFYSHCEDCIFNIASLKLDPFVLLAMEK